MVKLLTANLHLTKDGLVVGFESEFKIESKNAILAAQETVKVVSFDAFNTAIVISPVGNVSLWKTNYPDKNYRAGSFRSSWVLSYNGPSETVLDDIVSESQKVAELQGIFQRPYTGQYAYSSNLPYSQPIDNGHSSQAPVGVTSVVKLRIESRIPEIQRASDKKFGVS